MSVLGNIRIGNKLLVILATNIALLLVIGGVAAISAKSINNRLQQIFNRDLKGMVFLLEADRDLHQALIAERSMIFAEPGTPTFETQLKDYTENKEQADTRVGKFAALASDPEQLALVENYKTGRKTWDEVSLGIVDSRKAGGPEAENAELSLGEGKTRFDAMRENINSLTEILHNQAQSAEDDAKASYKSLLALIVALTVASAVIGAGCTLVVTRNITVPMAGLVDFTGRLAAGDFGSKLGFRRKDELGALGNAFDEMSNTLERNMEEIEAKGREAEEKAEAAEVAKAEADKAREAAEYAKRDGMLQAASQLEEIVSQVASASEQLNVQIQESQNGSEIQRERTAETATAMEEMNATVLEVASNASSAAENADTAKNRAEQGGQVVTRVVDSIAELNSETEKLGQEMAGLGKQAEAIGQVMTVISDIADQTNLLALNAAIEAARAGDAGRGFAVVADEVRKLAEKTMTATQEVGKAIGSIQESARNSIKAMEHTATMVGSSTELAGEAGRSLTEIIELIDNTADQVRAIATASEEQSATSEEINRGTEEINRISSETAEAMNQSAMAMQDIARLSDQLRSLIDNLKSA